MSGEAPAQPRPRRIVWTLIPVVVFVAFATVMYLALQSGDPSRLPSTLVGRPAPEFALPPLDGLVRSGAPVPGLVTADLKGEGVTIVNVWASWCAPCRQEHPVLMELARAGLRIVGINYKDDPENARRFLGTLGNPFQAVGTDDRGRSAIDWGVYGVPETFVVDDEGKVVMKHVGPLTAEAVEAEIVPAFKQAQSGQ